MRSIEIVLLVQAVIIIALWVIMWRKWRHMKWDDVFRSWREWSRRLKRNG